MKASNANSPDLPWNREISPHPVCWRAGLIAALLLLAGQIVFFEGAGFSRNPTLRPSLERLCRQLNCQLPAYKNLDEFGVLQGSLSVLPDRSQLFRTIIRNQAMFAQPYPNLELNMLDYAGNSFSRRIFRPQDYLSEAPIAKSALPTGATVEISLNIAALKTKVGGYTFELIY